MSEGVEWRGAHISDQKLEATAAFPLSSKRDTEGRNASPSARKFIFENGDRVGFDSGRGGGGGEGKILDSQLKASITPNAVAKNDQSLEIVIVTEEPVNAGGVLRRRRNEAEEREVLEREREREEEEIRSLRAEEAARKSATLN